MASKLVIVESPAKAKTLGKYLGSDYKITASMGHVRDLPEKELAVDIEKNFKPKYQIIKGKKKKVDELRKAAEHVKEIYLAMDPDREGEAIAWHIAHLLQKNEKVVHRVMFNEVTKDAVRAAVANPSEIDMNRVDAQQARRILDRLVGYLVSEQLWKVIYYGLSAGRVQSVALRMIVEREQEIRAFVPEEYWNIAAKAAVENTPKFPVKLVKLAGKEAKITGGEQAEGILNDLKTLPATLAALKDRISNQKPYAPFITSTLQQEAARRLGFTVKRTMMVAQKLYEGIELGSAGSVGLITYMRTDSPRISGVAIKASREYIEATYGKEYLSARARNFGKKKNAQDAHEAIRPTSMEWPPEKVKAHLAPEQYKLYQLIWNRFLATQMAEAKYEGVTVDIGVGKLGDAPFNGNSDNKDAFPYVLRATGRKLLFAGFRRLWGEMPGEDNGKKQSENVELPDIFFKSVVEKSKQNRPDAGIPAELSDVTGEQKFTQPPARFSESMLVKALDELGIGRPSTYAQIITTLLTRKYIEREEKKKLAPTELGETVNDVLVREFEEVFNVKYTALMEEALDKVEEGESWTDTVRKFWEPFSEHIEKFKGKKDTLKKENMKPTGRTCPECNEGELMERWGRFGKFISCDRYPKCKYIENIGKDGKPEEKKEPEKVGKKCPDCDDGELVVKSGRFGKFIACTNYPKCKHTEQIAGGDDKKKSNLPEINIPCPREGCKGTITAKRTRRGKIFYGCTDWKKDNCKVAFWDMPFENKCPECGYPLRVQKKNKLVCPECKHEEVMEDKSVDA